MSNLKVVLGLFSLLFALIRGFEYVSWGHHPRHTFHARPSFTTCPHALTLSTKLESLKSPEQANIESGGRVPKDDAWLRQIEDYGKARMAKKAVGVLDKMRSFKIKPTSEHYEEVLLACEKSDQFDQATDVYNLMSQDGVEKTVRCYVAMTSVAEKNGKWEESIDYLNSMKRQGLQPSTEIYNSCMWAADKGGHWELAIAMLEDMERENIPRDETTYAACSWACEKGGQGKVALHLIDLMHEDGITLNVQAYGAAIWSCVKAGMWEDALRLFDNLENECEINTQECLRPDIDIYTAAIWACDLGGKPDRAIELLKLAKYNGLKRQTSTFDAALSCIMKTSDFKQSLQLLKWMETENVPRSALSFKTVLHTLDAANRSEEMYEIYLQALREGYFSPWVGSTRKIDLSDFTTPVAKMAVKCVLDSMRTGKLDIFKVGIICECPHDGCDPNAPLFKPSDVSCIVDEDGVEHCVIDEDFGMNNVVDTDALSSFIVKQPPANILEIEEEVIESDDGGKKLLLTITRDSLAKWRYVAQESTNS